VIGEDLGQGRLFSGLTSESTVPAGSFPKAALVGANTVNGPCLQGFRRAGSLHAATSVV